MRDFVGELSEAIRSAEEELDAINNELKHLPFGNDIYKFVMTPKADRHIFFKICNRFADYANFADFYLSKGRDDEEMERDIQEFMNRILEEEDETEYADYRKYFTYDIKITSKRGEDVTESNLSTKQGSASGGEKQTPYYLILAASLMQCYPRNNCCVRLAFMDEAYSALSMDRIEQLVKYFEDNDFQMIYAAPDDKLGIIGPFVDTTIALYSSGKYAKAIEGTEIKNEN